MINLVRIFSIIMIVTLAVPVMAGPGIKVTPYRSTKKAYKSEGGISFPGVNKAVMRAKKKASRQARRADKKGQRGSNKGFNKSQESRSKMNMRRDPTVQEGTFQ